MFRKISDFLIDKCIVIASLMLVLTVISAFMAFNVKTNTDMTVYLSDSSEMKQGLDIMKADFPESAEKSSIRIMFDGLTKAQITEVKERLESIQYVESVAYDPESEDYNKDNHTLFIIASLYDYGTSELKAVETSLENDFKGYNAAYQSNSPQSTEVPPWLIIAALALLLIILLIMSKSWLEVILFSAVTGIAVIINLGTNIFLGSVSGLTMSVGPILQLILSLDYSVILMNRYRENLKKTQNKKTAMKTALAASFKSILSSAVTTVVGLIVLVFLSFKIGPEIGIVLAKGVFISMICVFTLLPCAVLLFSGGIDKTAKKSFSFTPKNPCGFAYRARGVITVVFILVLIISAVFQSFTAITFTEGNNDRLGEIFPKDNETAVIYKNEDEAGIDSFISDLSKEKGVKSIIGYTNTIGKKYTPDEMSVVISESVGGITLDSSILRLLYYINFDGKSGSMTLSEFNSLITGDIADNPLLSEYMGVNIREGLKQLSGYSDKSLLLKEMSVTELSSFMKMDAETVRNLMGLYIQTTGSLVNSMTPYLFITFINEGVIENPAFSDLFDERNRAELAAVKKLADNVLEDKSFTCAEFTELMSSFGAEIAESEAEILFLYASSQKSPDLPAMSLIQVFDFITDEIMTDERFAFIFDAQTTSIISETSEMLSEASSELKSEEYSRLVITTVYPEESEQTTLFMSKLDALREEHLTMDSYAVGASVMVKELQESFSGEYLIITLLTAAAILLVVALTFRSAVIPVILVLLVQCGVFITVSGIGLIGNSVYYLALLIVQSILMGATIDYAILFTNYYREYRAVIGVKESLAAAYCSSIHTVMTSGLILILVTAVLGFFTANITSQILTVISFGALSSVLLILFVLPSLLSFFDKAVRKSLF